MRRGMTRSAAIGGAAGLGLLALFLAAASPLGTAPPGNADLDASAPGGNTEPSPHRVAPPPRASLPQASRMSRSVEVELARAPIQAASFIHEPGAPDPSTRIATSTPAAVTQLPPAHGDLLPDGLPASGMRCTVENGVFQCGDCRTASDCPQGQGCVANRRTRRFECMASECEQDAHCFPGFVCRAVTEGASGPVVRRCVPEGQRKQGEPCDLLPLTPGGTCQEGLRCVQGVCGVPCRGDDATSCPDGYTCEASHDGPACFPDCRRLGCAQGQACKRTGESTYQCLVASQGDCRETPCPEGQHCNMRQARGRAVFWCAPVCNPLQPSACPGDQVCGMGSDTVSTCFRRCDPMNPESCGPGWQCATVSEDMTLWGCRPASP